MVTLAGGALGFGAFTALGAQAPNAATRAQRQLCGIPLMVSVLSSRPLIAHGTGGREPVVLNEATWLEIRRRIEEVA